MFRWLLSSAHRQGSAVRSGAFTLLRENADIMEPIAIEAVEKGIVNLDNALAGRDEDMVLRRVTELHESANEWLPASSLSGWSGQVREILVGIVLILSFNTFFLQLTKIPTGSMQPTLYGITYENLRGKKDVESPALWQRVFAYWVNGVSFDEVKAAFSGKIEKIDPVENLFPFVKRQVITYSGVSIPIWFPPENLEEGANIRVGMEFKAGDDIIKLRTTSGDHLLVDRFTYNFRKPERGEIFVFSTKSIAALPQDQLYIKRLVAKPNETVQITDDNRLVINGRKLSASDRHFEMLYSSDAGQTNNGYLGHVNNLSAVTRYGKRNLSPMFESGRAEPLLLGPDEYLAMGDNTLHSYDSRGWGPVPEQNILGKCWFVFWPLSERFGWGYR